MQFSQKKKSLKFDLQLVDEREKLEKIDEKIDVIVDDEEVDEIDAGLGEIGAGRRDSKYTNNQIKQIYGASNADTNFIEKFK